MARSIILQSCTGINHACSSHNYSFSLYPRFNLKDKFGGQHNSLSLLSSKKGVLTGDIIKRKFVVCSNGSLPPPPASNPFNGWVKGILLSIILPFFCTKWGTLLQLKHKVEDVIETVEEIVEGVEMVAEEVDKVVEHIGNDLPQGQLKNALEALENFSEETAKVAHAAGDFIDQGELELKEEEEEELLVDDLPKDQLKDFSDKVAYAAEDLKDKVQKVELKAEKVKSMVESVTDEVHKTNS